MFTALFRRLRRFRREESGLIQTEFLILLPILIWCFLGLYVFWDAYRTVNRAQKASYDISDLISRQGDINRAFLNGMGTLLDYLMIDPIDTKMRVTSFEWRQSTSSYRVLFSYSPGNRMPALTASGLAAMSDRIPLMANGDSLVLVETEVDFEPALNFGLQPETFRNFFASKPRFFRRVCLIETPCPATL